MKRLISNISLIILTVFTVTSALPVLAASCSRHMNKTAKIKCNEEDVVCKPEKTKNYDFKEIIKS